MTGNELRQMRLNLGLRQADVAEKLGVSYQSYQRLERAKDNEAKIPTDYFAPLSELFNVVIDVFIPRQGPVSISSASSGSGTAISAGGDVTTESSKGRKFTPKEAQALELKPLYDSNEKLLTEYIEKLLKIKQIHEG